jgi:predicted phage terminase large subunit-like protein
VGHDWVKARFLDPKTREKSAFFIPSSLNDNPSLDQESYKENLMHLLPADRERLLNGDWDVFEQGDYFHREWFPVVTEAPKGTTVRFWDRAATLDDGDFTVGTKLTLSAEGRWCVQDVVRGQWSSAGNETVIAQTAAQDGRSVFIRMEQEPGSAGKDVIDYYRRRVLVGYAFDGVPSTGDKRVRATPVSSAAQALNISIMPGEWNRKWLDELSLFPFGANDDQVDSLSGAFKFLSTLRRARILV